jgi:hypothetical protein
MKHGNLLMTKVDTYMYAVVSKWAKEIVWKQGKLASAEAVKEYLAKLSHDHRFIQELWA